MTVKAGTSMNQLSKVITEIANVSEETSNIIKTIDEIAFQTNLLALNAAVEAAKEQADGIYQINTAVSQMDKTTQQNAPRAQKAAVSQEIY